MAFNPGPNALPYGQGTAPYGEGRMDGTRSGTRLMQREAAERLDIDPDAGGPQPEPDTLTSELRDRLHYVEGQLEAERQAHAEARRLLMAALERIPPQLEAPQDSPPDAPQAPEGGEEQQGRGDVPTEPQTATSPRPWWRRVLGR